jgi:small subunit ribosomal protein S20
LANTRSAIKRIRSSERRRVRNRIVRSSTRTYVKKARATILSGNPSVEAIEKALSALDRAAAKGVIHKNNAARRKSRLMKQYNRALAAQG